MRFGVSHKILDMKVMDLYDKGKCVFSQYKVR